MTPTEGRRRRRALAIAVALAACATLNPSPIVAQQPASTTRAGTTQAGWNLRWRRSPKVTPQPVHVPQHDVFARQPAAGNQRQVAAAAVGNQPIARQSVRQQAVSSQPVHSPAARRSPAAQPINAFEQAVTSRAIRQVGHNEPLPSQPVGNYRPSRNATSGGPATVARPNDFFSNPFAAQAVTAPASQPQNHTRTTQSRVTVTQLNPQNNSAGTEGATAGGMSLPDATAEAPSVGTPQNALRGAAPDAAGGMGLPSPSAQELPSPMSAPETTPAPSSAPVLSTPAQDSTAPGAPAPGSPALGSPAQAQSMRDLLNDPQHALQGDDAAGDSGNQNPGGDDLSPMAPPANGSAQKIQSGQAGDRSTDSPSDKGGLDAYLDENPFNESRGRTDRDRNDNSAASEGQASASQETEMIKPNELSCEDFRARIARDTIDQISLDPSPPFRPDLFSAKDYEKQREKFESRQKIRPWVNIDGKVIATGRLRGLAYEQIVIETADGQEKKISVHDLNEGELGYLSENWGLPKQCRIEQVAYAPRTWTPLTMTWKASNLCSKPRYFEEVNLERYGHTTGPVLQPFVSSAHFFANIAVAPYKMGIHPPNECQYALGYYRPGNCAPWIVPPVPISARGALTQAAVMTGWFWLVP